MAASQFFLYKKHNERAATSGITIRTLDSHGVIMPRGTPRFSFKALCFVGPATSSLADSGWSKGLSIVMGAGVATPTWGLPLLPSAAASPARFVFCFKKKLALAAAGVTQGQIEKNRTLPRQGCSFVNCPPPVSGPVPLAKQCTWHRFMSDEGVPSSGQGVRRR